MAKSIVKATSGISVHVWETVRDFIINKPEVSLEDISKATGIPVKTIEAHALQSGWLTKKDLLAAARNQQELNRIMLEVAEQITEANEHAAAFLEALQYSHRIKIVKNPDGSISYRNFEEYPGRPDGWESLDETQREALRCYIAPARLSKFWTDILTVLNFKQGIISFVSKMSKASLPKMDVSALKLSNSGTKTLVSDTVEIGNLIDRKSSAGSDEASGELQSLIDSLNKGNNQ